MIERSSDRRIIHYITLTNKVGRLLRTFASFLLLLCVLSAYYLSSSSIRASVPRSVCIHPSLRVKIWRWRIHLSAKRRDSREKKCECQNSTASCVGVSRDSAEISANLSNRPRILFLPSVYKRWRGGKNTRREFMAQIFHCDENASTETVQSIFFFSFFWWREKGEEKIYRKDAIWRPKKKKKHVEIIFFFGFVFSHD